MQSDDMNAPVESARITVSRKLETDVRDRQIIVSLDGKKLATLLFGESVTRDIDPGSHRIRAHNTLFWKTIDFDAAAGEHVQFVTANHAGRLTYPLLGVLGVAPLYLVFDRR
jgi:hypothetical protein